MDRAGKYLLHHFRQLDKKYPGQYIAVVGETVVAAGRDQLKVYRTAEAMTSLAKTIGIYYLPTKKEALTALWIIPT